MRLRAPDQPVHQGENEMFRFAIPLLATAALLAPSLASAESVAFKASLSGAQEVPANKTAGSGEALVTLDTTAKTINYTVTYIGLTGPATMGHIHGPALPGANAAPVVVFKSPESPIIGTASLTDAQIADLLAGKFYVNVHTAENKGGEIRGQLAK
jgi:hypothetical protein